jgi:SAM-dependent methyltransferase
MNTNFLPNIKYIFSNPFYITRRYLYLHILEMAKYFSSGVLLDIGCGSKPYQSLFKVEKYIGMDYDKGGMNQNPNADILYNGDSFPIDSSSIDYVLATEVLEHVFKPKEFLIECNRVLKNGGFCLITVPFVWDEHEIPYDFGRYTSFGIKYLVEQANFEVIECRKSGHFLPVIGQLLSLYFYYLFRNHNFLLKLLIPTLFAFIQGLFLLLGKILPKIDLLYFDNIILIKKK